MLDPTYDDMHLYLSHCVVPSTQQEKDCAIYWFCRKLQPSKCSNIDRALHRIKYVPPAEHSEPFNEKSKFLLAELEFHYK